MNDIIVTTRLEKAIHKAAKHLAREDGRSLANYLRRLVEQDVLQRAGRRDSGIVHTMISTTPSDGLRSLHSSNGSRRNGGRSIRN
jgi:hypothetical protein